MEKALAQHSITDIPAERRILLQLAFLPDIHNDPFDRIIIATAHVHGLTIITRDSVIPKYPGVVAIWTTSGQRPQGRSAGGVEREDCTTYCKVGSKETEAGWYTRTTKKRVLDRTYFVIDKDRFSAESGGDSARSSGRSIVA